MSNPLKYVVSTCDVSRSVEIHIDRVTDDIGDGPPAHLRLDAFRFVGRGDGEPEGEGLAVPVDGLARAHVEYPLGCGLPSGRTGRSAVLICHSEQPFIAEVLLKCVSPRDVDERGQSTEAIGTGFVQVAGGRCESVVCYSEDIEGGLVRRTTADLGQLLQSITQVLRQTGLRRDEIGGSKTCGVQQWFDSQVVLGNEPEGLGFMD